jgi:hypothetical protein
MLRTNRNHNALINSDYITLVQKQVAFFNSNGSFAKYQLSDGSPLVSIHPRMVYTQV